jgi:tight adherence protein B
MMRAVVSGAATALAVIAAATAFSAIRRDRVTVASSGPRPPVPPVVKAVVAGIAGALVGGAIAGAAGIVIVGIGSAAIPFVTARRRNAKRDALIEEQLLDLVTSLASSMRSGRSLEQALTSAADEIRSPLGPTLRELVDTVALGVPLDDALERWSTRLGSDEARLVVGVLRLHRRAGGALTGPLDEVAATLRSRRSASRELRSLTAQARLSAAILGLLPVGFFLFLSVVSRRDIEDAIRTPAGTGAIAVGITMQAAAFVWIRSLLRVES